MNFNGNEKNVPVVKNGQEIKVIDDIANIIIHVDDDENNECDTSSNTPDSLINKLNYKINLSEVNFNPVHLTKLLKMTNQMTRKELEITLIKVICEIVNQTTELRKLKKCFEEFQELDTKIKEYLKLLNHQVIQLRHTCLKNMVLLNKGKVPKVATRTMKTQTLIHPIRKCLKNE